MCVYRATNLFRLFFHLQETKDFFLFHQQQKYEVPMISAIYRQIMFDFFFFLQN